MLLKEKITIPNTAEDLIENEKRNEKFKTSQFGAGNPHISFWKIGKQNVFSMATEIMLAMSNALGVRMNNVKIGKALTTLSFERIKHPQKQVYGYLIKRKIEDRKKWIKILKILLPIYLKHCVTIMNKHFYNR